tara:strand:+ start:75207 stop:75632 length:426 start_codon:yes stop_codon:yes gene_type:complete
MKSIQLPSVSKLKSITADKGNVIKFSHSEILISKHNENSEYYFTSIIPNSSKRWRLHQQANLFIFSILGNCLIDWKDPRDSLINTISLTPALTEKIQEIKYPVVFIPKKIEFRIRNISDDLALLACYSDIKHEKTELNVRY